MIYLDLNDGQQDFFFPTHVGKGTRVYTLTLTGTVSRKVYTVDNMAFAANYTHYIDGILILPTTITEPGEYEYSLVDSDGLVISDGLLVINETTPNPTVVQNSESITYTQYGNFEQ